MHHHSQQNDQSELGEAVDNGNHSPQHVHDHVASPEPWWRL